MDPLHWLMTAQIPVGPGILWREVIGNVLGLVSAAFGIKRLLWTWPVGLVANVLLFTVFLGTIFMTPQDMNLYGQAGRQVMFACLAVYGWVTWSRQRRGHSAQVAVRPRWTTGRERTRYVVVGVAIYAVSVALLLALHSYGPWADAWILTGSALAVYFTARGYLEAWLCWIAVDAVGVPLLFAAGLYPSAVLYLVYAGLAFIGFLTWLRLSRVTS